MLPLIFLALGALLLLVGALGRPGQSGKARRRRLEEVKARHVPGNPIETQLRKVAAQRASSLDERVTRLLSNPDMLRRRIEAAGKSWTLGRYAKACAGLGCATMLLLLLRGMPFLLSLFLGLLVGIGLPHFYLGWSAKRRLKKFLTKFPDAIELLVRGLRSGLPISETMQIVGGEVADPVGSEFRNVSDRMRIGHTMDAALQETADRLATPEFQFFVITLAIQRETGGNLAETLGNLADVLRKTSADEAQDQGDVVRVQGLGLYHRCPALLGVPDRLPHQSRLHDQVLPGSAPYDRRRWWAGLDVDRRVRHVQNDQFRDLSMSFHALPFGMDAVTLATAMSGMAVMALMLAIYAGLTARDPMAKRVKALNERREQLKAGITASTRKRAKLARTSKGTEQMRSMLASIEVLQDKQLKDAQRQLMQAGIRSKDAAITVIFARVALPAILGILMTVGVYGLGWFGDYNGFVRYLFVAGPILGGYYGPAIYLKNRINKRSAAIPQAAARCARPAGNLRRGRPYRRRRFLPCLAGAGQGVARAW